MLVIASFVMFAAPPGSGRLYSNIRHCSSGVLMIILGIILLIIGFIAKIAIVWTIGIIALVIGLVLILLSTLGHAVGGRKHFF